MNKQVIKTTVEALPLSAEEAKAIMSRIPVEAVNPQDVLDEIVRLATYGDVKTEATPADRICMIREELDVSEVITEISDFIKDQDKKSDLPY